MSRAEIKTDPMTADVIKRYLDTTDDFQLEIDVFRMCREAGFEATHGGSYRDPLTRKNRQYDVRAHYSEGGRHVRLAIECKNLGDFYPLLVSTIPRRPNEAKLHAVVTSGEGINWRCELFEFKSALFQPGEPVGKATARVGVKRSKDEEFVKSDGEVTPRHKQWF